MSPTTLAEQVDLVSAFSGSVVRYSAKRSVPSLLRGGFKGVKRDLSSCLELNERLNLRAAVNAAETAALEFEARLSDKVAKADRKGFEQGDLKDLLGEINSLKQKTFDRYRSRFAVSGDGLHRIDDSTALRDEIASRLDDVQGNFIKHSLNVPSNPPEDSKPVNQPDIVSGKRVNTENVSLEGTDQQSKLMIHQPVSEIKVRLGGDRSITRGKSLKDSTVNVGLDGESRLISHLPEIRNSVIRAKGGSNTVMDFRTDRLTGVTAKFGNGGDRLILSADSLVRKDSQFNMGGGTDLARLDGVIRSGLIDLGYDRDVDRVVLDDRRQIKDELTISNIGPSDVLQIGEREYSGVDLRSKELKGMGITVTFQDDLFCEV